MKLTIPLLSLILLAGSLVQCAGKANIPEPVRVLQKAVAAKSVTPLPKLHCDGWPAEILLPEPSTFSLAPTISPDGSYLFFISELEWTGFQSFILNLKTGQMRVAKMPEQQVVKLGGIRPLSFIDQAVWDPIDPQYLYVQIPDRFDDQGRLWESTWRINVTTMTGKQILPSSNENFLVNVTPDGKSLLISKSDMKTSQHYLYEVKTDTWNTLPKEMQGAIYSPNGEMISGLSYDTEADNPEVALTIEEVRTRRTTTLFRASQTLLSLPPDKQPHLTGIPMWLTDSSAMLINISFPGKNGEGSNAIWKIAITGETSRIVTDVELIANSANGRYWLARYAGKLFVIGQ